MKNIILTETQLKKLIVEISPELKKRAAKKALADYKSSDSPSLKAKRMRQYKTFSDKMDIDESLEDEIEKLNEFGYEVIDMYRFSSYIMLLLKSESGEFEVSLTTGDDEFTTFDSQKKKPTKETKSVSISKKLINKIKEWLDSYGDLIVGSLNKKRTGVYWRIFNNLGFKTSEIEITPPDDNFPESYNFKLYSDK